MSWKLLVFNDWSEFDLLDLSDAEEGALLSQTLVEVDSQSAVEKNPNLVLSIYHAILDLKLAGALKLLDSELWGLQGELIAVFQVVGKEYNLDDSESCALASKLWLERHTERFSCLKDDWAMSHSHGMESLYDKVLCPSDYDLHSFEGIRRKGSSFCHNQSQDLPVL
jgi:hypothetical protein